LLKIGLTGDVGAGKSTLCQVWKSMGAEIIDADTIARDMWKLPEVQKKAEKKWGKGFFNAEWKEVCAKIAAKIFSNEDDYDFASQLLHAATAKEIKKRLRSETGLVITEVPLLFENGGYKWCDGVVYAAATLKKRAERNKSRGWNRKEVKRREAKLMPRKEKIARADWVLKNNGTIEEWESKARELGNVFIGLLRQKQQKKNH